MDKGDQAKDNLEAKRLDVELCLNNGMWNRTFASNDGSEKQGLNSLQLGPIYLYQARFPYLRAIEYYGFDNHLHEVELG
jgi:hypothetical protein